MRKAAIFRGYCSGFKPIPDEEGTEILEQRAYRPFSRSLPRFRDPDAPQGFAAAGQGNPIHGTYRPWR
jgi:hypothetical protein